eukprot:7101515-Prorocentrum_lima.AAC.1
MTSSLVGSEMCIRDRYFHVNRVLVPVPRHSQEPASGRSQSSASGTGTSCLLYTSDAADDM